MRTDASSLKTLLEFALNGTGKTALSKLEIFSATIRKYLELPKEDNGEAILATQQLSFRVYDSLNKMGLPAAQLKSVKGYFEPLKPLLNYNTYTERTSSLTADWLKQENVNQLIILDALMASNGFQKDEFEGVEALIEQAKHIQTNIDESELALGLKDAMSQRMSQIIEAMRNHKIYGTVYLTQSIEALIGSLDIAETALVKSDKGLEGQSKKVKQIKKLATVLYGKVDKSRKMKSNVKFVTDMVGDIGGFIENFQDQG